MFLSLNLQHRIKAFYLQNFMLVDFSQAKRDYDSSMLDVTSFPYVYFRQPQQGKYFGGSEPFIFSEVAGLVAFMLHL